MPRTNHIIEILELREESLELREVRGFASLGELREEG
jgi:hypothetical protein